MANGFGSSTGRHQGILISTIRPNRKDARILTHCIGIKDHRHRDRLTGLQNCVDFGQIFRVEHRTDNGTIDTLCGVCEWSTCVCGVAIPKNGHGSRARISDDHLRRHSIGGTCASEDKTSEIDLTGCQFQERRRADLVTSQTDGVRVDIVGNGIVGVDRHHTGLNTGRDSSVRSSWSILTRRLVQVPSDWERELLACCKSSGWQRSIGGDPSRITSLETCKGSDGNLCGAGDLQGLAAAEVDITKVDRSIAY